MKKYFLILVLFSNLYVFSQTEEQKKDILSKTNVFMFFYVKKHIVTFLIL